MSQELHRLEQILDARRASARKAFSDRDIKAYSDLFATRLEYVRANGKTIDRASLMDDVAVQFKKVDRFDSHYTREALSADGSLVTETTLQKACVEVRAFGIVTRIDHIERRGHYTWAEEAGVWKIIRVVILNEDIRTQWKFGLLSRA